MNHNRRGLCSNRDELVIIKLEEDSFENAETNGYHNIEGLKLEKEILQREKENAELKAALKELKHEKEKLEINFENEKLKSEVSLLKAEKQFGINNVKALSDGKRRIEDELKMVVNKKAKIQEESRILIQNSERLREKIGRTENEKNKFEKLYNEAKLEKENLLKHTKSLEGTLKEVMSKMMQANKESQIKSHSAGSHSVSAVQQSSVGDYSRMPLLQSIATGVSMVFETALYSDYENWYSNVNERIQNFIRLPSCLLIKKFSLSSCTQYINLGLGNLLRKVKHVKLLHTKDNTKSKVVEHIGEDEWLINGLTNDYMHANTYLILVILNTLQQSFPSNSVNSTS